MIQRIIFTSLFFLLSSTALFAQSKPYIIYSTHDANISPRYNRSYDLVANEKGINYSVRSYQDTLYKTYISLASAEAKEMFQLLVECDKFSRLVYDKDNGFPVEYLKVGNQDTVVLEKVWNNQAPERIQTLINFIKSKVEAQGESLGMADYDGHLYFKQLEEHIESRKAVHTSTYSSLKDAEKNALDILRSTFNEQSINFDYFYIIPSKTKAKKERVRVLLIHRDTFKFEVESKLAGSTIEIDNPSKLDGVYTVDLATKKVVDIVLN